MYSLRRVLELQGRGEESNYGEFREPINLLNHFHCYWKHLRHVMECFYVNVKNMKKKLNVLKIL